jgi:hypothetical protein
LDPKLPARPVDSFRSPTGKYLDSLRGGKVSRVTDDAVPGTAERLGVTDIIGEDVREPASSVRVNVVLLNDGDFPGRFQAGQAAGTPMEDVEGALDLVLLAYVRTLDFFGLSAKLDASIPHAWGGRL